MRMRFQSYRRVEIREEMFGKNERRRFRSHDPRRQDGFALHVFGQIETVSKRIRRIRPEPIFRFAESPGTTRFRVGIFGGFGYGNEENFTIQGVGMS